MPPTNEEFLLVLNPEMITSHVQHKIDANQHHNPVSVDRNLKSYLTYSPLEIDESDSSTQDYRCQVKVHTGKA